MHVFLNEIIPKNHIKTMPLYQNNYLNYFNYLQVELFLFLKSKPLYLRFKFMNLRKSTDVLIPQISKSLTLGETTWVICNMAKL